MYDEVKKKKKGKGNARNYLQKQCRASSSLLFKVKERKKTTFLFSFSQGLPLTLIAQ